MGDSSETKTKVLSRELFLGVVALKTPVPQNHYLRDKVPFPKSGHIYVCVQKKIIIEQTRDLNYLKFVATDFSPKTIIPSAGENSGDLA